MCYFLRYRWQFFKIKVLKVRSTTFSRSTMTFYLFHSNFFIFRDNTLEISTPYFYKKSSKDQGTFSISPMSFYFLPINPFYFFAPPSFRLKIKTFKKLSTTRSTSNPHFLLNQNKTLPHPNPLTPPLLYKLLYNQLSTKII